MKLANTSCGSLTHIIETAIGVFILGKILERQREVINIIYTDLKILERFPYAPPAGGRQRQSMRAPEPKPKPKAEAEAKAKAWVQQWTFCNSE